MKTTKIPKVHGKRQGAFRGQRTKSCWPTERSASNFHPHVYFLASRPSSEMPDPSDMRKPRSTEVQQIESSHTTQHLRANDHRADKIKPVSVRIPLPSYPSRLLRLPVAGFLLGHSSGPVTSLSPLIFCGGVAMLLALYVLQQVVTALEASPRSRTSCMRAERYPPLAMCTGMPQQCSFFRKALMAL